MQEAAAITKKALSSRFLDQGRAEPVLVIVVGLQVGPALVLAPGSLLSLRLLPVLSCLLRLPVSILQADPLGLRPSRVMATKVSCLGFPAGLFLPSGFQEFVELLLGGKVSARREGRERWACLSSTELKTQ